MTNARGACGHGAARLLVTHPASFIQSANLNGLDPYVYIRKVFTRLSTQ
jgi:hypothetical protein